MPFLSSVAGESGYGRYITLTTQSAPVPPTPTGAAPAYYTQNTGWLMNQPGYSVTTLQLKYISSLQTSAATRTYTGLTAAWTTIHDKDLDSNVYYNMAEGGPKTLRRYVLAKGGTTVTVSSMFLYSGATTSVLGACYAPQCMWTNSTTTVGAFIIGGFSQAVLHVLEFGTNRTITSTYTVPYTSEVYGTEVVPKAASGFSKDYGIAYTRNSRQMSSWTADMFTRSWTNRRDNSYSPGVNGPSNGNGMIYYPIGKQISFNDLTTSTNRIAMNDTSSAALYTWNITEHAGLSSIVWTYNSTIRIAESGGYPYHMSSNAYNSIS
jgi:hypothetical protein